MVYDKNGNTITTVYDRNGIMLSQCYDLAGNELIDTPTPSRYRTFSVLADSYGAIQGGVTPDTNVVYYPTEGNDVTSISQMWWYLFGESYGCTLVRNNSFSGSRVANDSSWYAGAENCYIGRAQNIGNPDIILVMGGTNDVWNSIPQGDYVYLNWSESDLATFRGALAYLLNYLLTNYNAKVVFLCNTIDSALSPDQTRYPLGYEYYVSAHTVCDHYSVDVIDFKVDFYGNHPTAYGMKQINHLLMKKFGVSPNIVDTIGTNATYPFNADWSPNHRTLTLAKALKAETLYRIDINVTNYTAESAYVQIQTNGSTTSLLCNFKDFAGETGEASVVVWASGYADGVTSISLSCNKGDESANQTATISDLKIYEVGYNS